MKHVISFMALSAVMMLSSCITVTKTARTANTSSSIQNATVADLKVTDKRITYTMTPSKEIQRAGLSNVKQAALQEALTMNGNADVMVEPEFVISMKNKFIFGKEVTSITVTGRPAYYQNFRTLNDSVWSSPGFYGQPNVVYVNSASDLNNGKRGGLAGKLTGKNRGAYEDTGYHRSGFGGKFEAIGGIQKGEVAKGGSGKSDTDGYAGGLLTLGYNITGNLFVGAGTGFFWDFGDIDEGFIPIFGDVRFNFSSRSRSTWFVDAKVGGAVYSREKRNNDTKPGLYAMASAGYSFGGLDLALQWGTQSYGSKHGSSWRVDVSHFGLSLGISF